MTSEVLTKLWKYKKQLDAFLKRNEDDKVLIMLQKVNKLNVTIEMIKETSIGKLVNSITSKEELGIGQKAAGLVDKWRRLIEEVVDKKYKSDEEPSPPQKARVGDSTTNRSPQNSKKPESSEKHRLKRKSEAPEERHKPPKQSRTSNKSVISTESKEPLPEESSEGSFLMAINHKLSNPKKSSAAVKPVGSPTPEIEEDFDEAEDSAPEKSPRMPEAARFEYPDEVFEHLENLLAMFEDRKKAQATKVVENDNLGGRTYAVPSLFCGKKVETQKNIPTYIEKFQHLLYDNIENTEYIGDVPYDILEPVLRKLNPNQLERFEYFNPIVVQKSDDIWKMHVLRKYPGRKPDEFGSWREVFLDGRDAMKAKFEQCLQKFSTNVAKMKQEEHKTKFFDPCMARVGKRSSRDVFGRNGGSSGSMGASLRGRAFPQKAPLMQKTLKMMKSTSKR